MCYVCKRSGKAVKVEVIFKYGVFNVRITSHGISYPVYGSKNIEKCTRFIAANYRAVE